MKIEFEVNDFEEFLSAFNNSIVALQDIYAALYFGCEIPSKFEKMLKEKFGNNYEAKIECLRNRVTLLYNIYKEFENAEYKGLGEAKQIICDAPTIIEADKDGE